MDYRGSIDTILGDIKIGSGIHNYTRDCCIDPQNNKIIFSRSIFLECSTFLWNEAIGSME